MADDKQDNKQRKKADDAPEGFDVNVGRQLGDGWVKKGEGVTVQGRLLGRFIGNQQDDDGVYQAFYQIKLQVPCPATRKNKETQEVEEVTLEPGQVVNVGEHKALEDLSPKTRDGGVYNVWFRYLKQEKIPNSRRTFWSISGPRLQVLKPAQHAPLPAEVRRGRGNTASTSMGDDDIPFE